jgi:hypothetical protein
MHLQTPALNFPDLRQLPGPLWALANLARYATMSLQFSRGCPFDSEFCNITSIPGTKLYQRLNRQGRLLRDTTGDNADGITNFLSRMNPEMLRQGYRSLLEYISSRRPC